MSPKRVYGPLSKRLTSESLAEAVEHDVKAGVYALEKSVTPLVFSRDDFLADVNKAVGTGALKNTLKEMYVAGQEPSYREDVHLSDLIKPDVYRGKPSFCHRQIVLSAHFKPQQVMHPHPKVAIFERGTDMHRRWQEKFLRAGYVVYRQGVLGLEAVHEVQDLDEHGLPTQYNWKLLFTPDVIVDMKDGTGIEIVELKGYKSSTYTPMVKDNNYIPEDAYKQVSMYMYLTGIHNAMIIVECKDNQDFLARRVTFNPAVVAPYQQRIADIDMLVQIYRDSGRLPKRICADSSVPRAQECAQRCNCFCSAGAREAHRKV